MLSFTRHKKKMFCIHQTRLNTDNSQKISDSIIGFVDSQSEFQSKIITFVKEIYDTEFVQLDGIELVQSTLVDDDKMLEILKNSNIYKPGIYLINMDLKEKDTLLLVEKKKINSIGYIYNSTEYIIKKLLKWKLIRIVNVFNNE